MLGLEHYKSNANGKLCEPCVKGKAHREAFQKKASARSEAQHVLARVHADLMGPMQTPSLDGAEYVLVLVDEWSRMVFAIPLRSKAEIIAWCKAAKAKHGRGVVEFHSDGGGEFSSQVLLDFFRSEGITPTQTPANTPQRNGIAERMNRTLIEMTLPMMQHAKVPMPFWAEGVQAAAYIRNRVTLRTVGDTTATPEGLWHNAAEKPSVGKLRVWGCNAWLLVQDARQKLDAKARAGIMVGYDEGAHAWRVLDVERMRIVSSRDVTFDEGNFSEMQRYRDRLLLSDDDNDEYAAFDDFLELQLNANELRLREIIRAEQSAAANAPQARVQAAQQICNRLASVAVSFPSFPKHSLPLHSTPLLPF